MLSPTSERLIPEHAKNDGDRLMYLRHLFAYEEAGRRVAGAGSVLDVGCGEGYGTARLAEGAAMATGVDVDAATVDHATRAHGHARCRFLTYDGRRLPFEPDTFDAAVSCQVIEHVRDDAEFVADVARVLRPGGSFFVTTPNRVLRLDPGQRPWNRYHVREYAPDDLRRVLMEHFREVEVIGISGDAEVHAHEMARLRQARRAAARDPFGIRYLLPEWLRHRLLGLWHPQNRTSSDSRRWSVEKYHLTRNAVEALDLLAICRR